MSKLAIDSERKVIQRNATQDDYFALDEDQYRHTEMIEGEISMAAMPAPRHQIIVTRLVIAIQGRASARQSEVLPGLDVVLSRRTTLQPDVLYFADFSKRHADSSQDLGILPDLVVEIISPQGEERDRVTKFALYQKAGITNYWIVDPEQRSIDAFTLVSGAYQIVAQPNAAELAAPPFTTKPILLGEIFPAD